VNGTARILALLALVTGIAVAGCGNSGEKKASGGNGSGKTPRRSGPSLSRPVYPRCAFPTFAKPTASPTTAFGGSKAWQLSYRPQPLSRTPPPEQTSNVLIVEQSPVLPPPSVTRGHATVVAGRRVSLRAPDATSDGFVAAWRTRRARYVVLANGKRPATLKRFIACLP
jgi:hypothetical protein